GQYFTYEQTREILHYAEARGIRVVPEFDLPGHETSWFVGYPQYASAPGPYRIEDYFGIFDPVFDPTQEGTYEFLEKFLGEMTALFPDDYVHVGGDENTGVHWKQNPRIQAFMKAHNLKSTEELQAHFTTRVARILEAHGKKTVGWEEILAPGLPQSAVIQSWRGRDSLYKAARQGYGTILSNGYYIDLMEPAKQHYLSDPIPPDVTLPEAVRKHILGGEATMWSELVSPLTVDSRIWPRTAAIAERLWSPASVKDVDFMYQRLSVISRYLELVGTTHIRNQTVLLRQLAGQDEIGPLRILVDVIEPLKGYERNKDGKLYTRHSPLTLIADAATADAPDARQFGQAVERYLADPAASTAASAIRRYLRSWIANAPVLLNIMARAPALHEVRPMVVNLKDLAEIGVQALDALEAGRTTPSAWAGQAQQVIARARQSYGRTELMVVDAVDRLVKKAKGQ
ncbi:MAG: family 20 glycosylhydrolase, partial [Candidatus Rokubacteria bacterium]|nr:family 20 glycosylhydrolase [Candidatus Rokubacteria bacterium]